jgi:hypothetical protein
MDRSPHITASVWARMDTPLQQREGEAAMKCIPLGIDLAKSVFQHHGVDKLADCRQSQRLPD